MLRCDKLNYSTNAHLHLITHNSPSSFHLPPSTPAVKALGTALGVQVLVFNCDEGFDHGSLGRIMAGLATVGSWGCFGALGARRGE